MRKLFAPESLRAMEALSFTPTLYAFDYDGTLSRIARDPNSARTRASTDRWLERLAEHAPVAIVSGRSVTDLRRQLKFTPAYLIGNHGLEGLSARPDSLDRARESTQTWKAALLAQLSPELLAGGVVVEDKTYSIAVHYRASPTRRKAKLAILALASAFNPVPRIILGKCVVNLVPAGAPHKGVALMELMLSAGVSSAFYIGDDDTDEDVFTLPNAHLFTVRVGHKEGSSAQYFINGQREIDPLLRMLVGFYQAE